MYMTFLLIEMQPKMVMNWIGENTKMAVGI